MNYNHVLEESLRLISLNVADDIIKLTLDSLIVEVKPCIKSLDDTFSSIVTNYLDAKKDNVSSVDYEGSLYFYTKLCPSLFKELLKNTSPLISSITYEDLLNFKVLLIQLPKRNIQIYKMMSITTILSSLNTIPVQQRISANTVNKYIQRLRSIFEFALNLGLLNHNLAKSIRLVHTDSDKLQRLPLDEEEQEILSLTVPKKMRYLLEVLAVTGMRLSELYKCEVTIIDDVKCFSLTNREIKLKTKSSYRIIPIHPKLLHNIENFEELRRQVSSDNLAKTTSATIKKLGFKDKEKKSLYSLRHSFATTLIRMGADTSIVSELMGHSHRTMTLSRYSTGFSTEQLKDVINLL